MPFRTRPISITLCLLTCLSGCSFDTDIELLNVVTTTPEDRQTWPADQPIRVIFDRYLDPMGLDTSKFKLNSGEAGASIRLAYDPVGPSIVVQPTLAMRVGVGYTLTIEPQAVRGLDGSEFQEPHSTNFTAGQPDSDLGAAAPIDFDNDLKPVIEARCGCHGPEPAAYPEMSPEKLINQVAQRQENRVLVRPGQPLNSYLIQRILTRYPGVRGMEKDLTNEERRMFVRWVNELSGDSP